ncbi:peptide methionine sulfoxide reductase MsrA [Devosia pacifica]|uniref:Peptide methionine sulfoxide reductase MsrA n=1 Tax=Devosia pacifica TaxID=1335967 RepID=A0A918VQN9_9HYPH|nr:peptide-methionine (S)-S-oxide reductase MsrA [Devosia pacifica]GHA17109.1 peptide methionine sulfoxide reductase MsrA [Devosia pacifica]
MFTKTIGAGATLGVAGLSALLLASAYTLPAFGEEEPFIIPAPSVDATSETDQDQATALFAAGCFWGVQAVFQHVDGVTAAVSGYAGGTADTADYETVSSGRTEHAEAVEITYDPDVVSYGELLHILFSVVHDPTQLNYQGPDYGTQYRSAIFPMSEEQEQIARAYIEQLDQTGVYSDDIVTTIESADTFYPAEEYHQDFLVRNPNYPYIVRFDMPKLENLEAVFPEYYRQEPELVLASN